MNFSNDQFSPSLHSQLSPTHTLRWPGRNCVQITCNTSSAYNVQHAVYLVGTAQSLSLTELKSHLFFSFIFHALNPSLFSHMHSVSKACLCTATLTSCNTEMEAADQTCHFTLSDNTDLGPASPSTDPFNPGV